MTQANGNICIYITFSTGRPLKDTDTFPEAQVMLGITLKVFKFWTICHNLDLFTIAIFKELPFWLRYPIKVRFEVYISLIETFYLISISIFLFLQINEVECNNKSYWHGGDSNTRQWRYRGSLVRHAKHYRQHIGDRLLARWR